MRIVPVTGDLPALVTSAPPPVRHVIEPPPAPATAPVEQTSSTDTDPSTAGSDRHPSAPKTFFDPPLIAQRAVLGLPTGALIAEYAQAERIPFTVAAAAVDREMPRDRG